jgi:hypothetical protein
LVAVGDGIGVNVGDGVGVNVGVAVGVAEAEGVILAVAVAVELGVVVGLGVTEAVAVGNTVGSVLQATKKMNMQRKINKCLVIIRNSFSRINRPATFITSIVVKLYIHKTSFTTASTLSHPSQEPGL